MSSFTGRVDGPEHAVDVDENTPLLWMLRSAIGLMDMKYGRGRDQGGACAVYIGGERARSCVTSVSQVSVLNVTTFQGIVT